MASKKTAPGLERNFSHYQSSKTGKGIKLPSNHAIAICIIL
jgi:hypothetical protein